MRADSVQPCSWRRCRSSRSTSVVGSLTWRLLAGLPIAGLAGAMILAQVAVHCTANPSFECPKRHRAGVAGPDSLVVIVASWAVQSKLGDGDAMNRRIKLPVTVFRSTHPSGGPSGPVWNWGQTGMLRERRLTGEAGDECG